jgi:HK97 family phage major capsid protein/HK97 family phage prohead protease
VERAYSVLTIKSVNTDQRVITGIATTPTPDRLGDVLEPLGASYTNPLPLLFHHDPTQPVGTVIFDAPTKRGITFTASLPLITEPGRVRDRVDEAWQSVKAGLIRGMSIGFQPLETKPRGRGLHILKSLIAELSLVTIPANIEATVLTVKSAASGQHQPGVSGVSKARTMKNQTAGEHIQNLENKRAALTARMAEIMNTAAEGDATTDAAQAEEHDGLAVQVKSIDGDLGRWRDLEKLQIASAVPVPVVKSNGSAYGHVSVRPNVDPGIMMARFVIAKIASRYEGCDAATYAEKRWADSTPEVALALKAAVVAGTTTDAVWAKPLVNPSITADFLPLLRAATIIGKIEGLRKVPFNVNVPAQTGGAAVTWVGELKPKPVSAMAFAMENLTFNKVAAIVVLSQELVRFSNPSAEAVVRDSLVKDIAAYLDAQFINPAVALVAGVNPASITNGAPTAAATANPLADILGLINHFATNNIPVDGLTFILSPSNALALSFRTNLDGSPEFPGIGINGGSYKGLQFITSNVATTNVVALAPQYILFADDGGVTIDASTEASLQMDSAPASPPDATTVYASMFQMNAVALRAERYITWKRVGTNTVKYLTATAWPSPTGAMAAPEANGRAHKA